MNTSDPKYLLDGRTAAQWRLAYLGALSLLHEAKLDPGYTVKIEPLTEEQRQERRSPTATAIIDSRLLQARADPIEIIRALLADLGAANSELPSVKAAYDYLEALDIDGTVNN